MADTGKQFPKLLPTAQWLSHRTNPLPIKWLHLMSFGRLKFNMPKTDFRLSSQSLASFSLLTGTTIHFHSHPSPIPEGHPRFPLLPATHPVLSYCLLNTHHIRQSLSSPLSLPGASVHFLSLDHWERLLNVQLAIVSDPEGIFLNEAISSIIGLLFIPNPNGKKSFAAFHMWYVAFLPLPLYIHPPQSGMSCPYVSDPTQGVV